MDADSSSVRLSQTFCFGATTDAAHVVVDDEPARSCIYWEDLGLAARFCEDTASTAQMTRLSASRRNTRVAVAAMLSYRCLRLVP